MHHLMQEQIACAKQLSVSDRTPHDLAQHIPASVIGRYDAICDQKRGGARMIGYDPQRCSRMRTIFCL